MRKDFNYGTISFSIFFNSPVEYFEKEGFSSHTFCLLASGGEGGSFGGERPPGYGSFSIVLNRDSCKYVVWPNREGEIFEVSGAIESLKRYGFVKRGVYINYPATAFSKNLILMDDKGGVIVGSLPDKMGRVTEFRLRLTSYPMNKGTDRLEVVISAPLASRNSVDSERGSSWLILPYRGGWESCREKIEEMYGNLYRTYSGRVSSTETDDVVYRYMLQVGLIDQRGKTNVDPGEGFEILKKIARVMKENLGEHNILHVFGYGKGHDVAYPDYSPASILGGREALVRAIEGIHEYGQVVSLYMNGRIADGGLVEVDKKLYSSVLRDSNGNPVTEIYSGRKFYVMNPSSGYWIDRLVKEASALKDMGADIVQLDQLGGRKSPLPPGSEWGKGYLSLIDRIHELGLKVWIQGLSDIYGADWFEATYREVSILDDGTLRGGMPFGRAFLKFFRMVVPDGRVLIPLSKLDLVESEERKYYTIDLQDKPGDTFFYGPDYFERFFSMVNRLERAGIN